MAACENRGYNGGVRRAIFCLFTTLSLLAFLALSVSVQAAPLLGFTRWPSDLSLEGVQTADDFIKEHGNIAALHLERGIPWPEALAGTGYSKDVVETLSYRPPAGHKLFVSINPLNIDRAGLAPYWGAKDNMALPAPWDDQPFDAPDVITAYGNFAEHVVAQLRPDYLAIGVESNILLTKKPQAWPAYVRLHQAVYARLKQRYPTLPVFFTVDVQHLQGYFDDADAAAQDKSVRALLDASDLFALSSYPFMAPKTPRPIPADYFAFARNYGKPIAVAETGYTTQDVNWLWVKLRGTPALQEQYYSILLQSAVADNYAFVITYAGTDFDRMIAKLPWAVRGLAGIWQYTGLQTADKEPKPALKLWDSFLRPARP